MHTVLSNSDRGTHPLYTGQIFRNTLSISNLSGTKVSILPDISSLA
ncbi:hypothetical protein AB85_5052 [Escherichia coli 2-156-04_S3_C1]|nr:hypothetical protein AB85_5052 [Escherichia coli 2-156-04_S3_C1]